MAFLLLIAVTVGAFLATDAGAFKSAPTARLAVVLPQDEVAPGTAAESVDPSFTASTGNMSTAPACNYKACARAFRSFRISDCTFQASDGPRRACTK